MLIQEPRYYVDTDVLGPLAREAGSQSQWFQDYFAAEHLFAGKRGGVFLDCGGSFPKKHNNTWLLETAYGWSGLAFEPQSEITALWAAERQTPCLPIALGDKTGSVELHVPFEGTHSHSMGASLDPGAAGPVNAGGAIRLDTRSVDMRRLDDVLRENAVSRVDFMSLDIEGCEIPALDGLDLNAVPVSALSIENNRSAEEKRALRTYMAGRGYCYFARLGIDDVFLAQNFPLADIRPFPARSKVKMFFRSAFRPVTKALERRAAGT
jgi:FkbM family methyltransferase